MGQEKKSRRPVSIRTDFVLQILLFTAPIVLLLFVSNVLAIHTITEKVMASNQSALNLYMGGMEDRLDDVDRCLYNLLVLDTDVEALVQSQHPNQAGLTITALNRTLYEDLMTYSVVEGIFVYVERWDVCVNAKTSYDYYLDQNRFKDYVREVHLNTDYSDSYYARSRWHLAEVTGVPFLMGDVSTADAHIGAYVSVDACLRQLREGTGEQFEYLYFETADGQVLGEAPPEDVSDYLVVRAQDRNEMYTLVGLMHRDTALAGLPRWQTVTTVVAIILSLLLVAFMLKYLQRTIVHPVGAFTQAMQQVEQGDLSARLEEPERFLEFTVMGECFNSMVVQIEHLKISVYEEQLDTQKAQLRFLQLQSSPHFYLNSLNVLYSLAMKQDLDLLKRMVLALSRYSRYMLKSADTRVLLQDELDHVGNYVALQKERLPYPVEYTASADPSLLETEVPPLLIQTFVENSFKYGIHEGGTLRIDVEVAQAQWRDGAALRLSVRDWGGGFPEAVLEVLKKGDAVTDDLGNEHYGIENIRQRLGLIYGDRVMFSLSNHAGGGAQAEIVVPLLWEEDVREAIDRG